MTTARDVHGGSDVLKELFKNIIVDKRLIECLRNAGVISDADVARLQALPAGEATSILLQDVLRSKTVTTSTFEACLRAAGQEKVADKLATVLKPGGQLPTKELPSIDEKMESLLLGELRNLCGDLKVDTSCFRSTRRYQRELTEYYQRLCGSSAISPPLAGVEELLKDLARKRQEFLYLIDNVEEFTKSAQFRPWLEKLNVHKLSAWMMEKAFQACRQNCTQGTPAFLVAGSTSSGKSSLINALLGEDILPVSHNAATSVLCEIKYSDRKYAVAFIEKGDDEEEEELNLSMEGADRKKFEKYVNRSKGDVKDREANSTSSPVCRKVDVYWPSHFLKSITIVDSPGVTEKTAYPEARQITEHFQSKFACGIIYVLDATRSSEEAGEAGGLLASLAGSFPCPGAVLFVLSKWDLLETQQKSDEERQEFIAKVKKKLAHYWPGFLPRQLFFLNTKSACLKQKMGKITNDLKKLYEGIKRIIPDGADAFILRNLVSVQSLLDKTEQVGENMIRRLRLPVDQRPDMVENEWKRLDRLKDQASKRMEEAKAAVECELKKLVTNLVSYLQSKEGMRFARERFFQVRMTRPSKSDVEHMLKLRLLKTIFEYSGFQSFSKWTDEVLLSMLDEILVTHDIPVGTDKAAIPSVAELLLAMFTKRASEVGVGEIVLRSSYVGVGIGLSVASAFIPVAGPIISAGLSLAVLYGNAFFVRQSIEASYEKLVKSLCGNEKTILDYLREVLLSVAGPLQTLYIRIPQFINDLQNELEAIDKAEQSDIPFYRELVRECKALKSRMSYYVMTLAVHEYADSDIKWPNPKDPVARGNYGEVFKVSLPDHRTGAVKKIYKNITTENAEEFVKELAVARSFDHPHLVILYGSALLSSSPLRLGLVFEWCEGGSLDKEILATDRAPAQTLAKYSRAQSIMEQILSGLQYLHSRDIVHRDLKPENILLKKEGETCKIADVGQVKEVDQITGTYAGTPLFMAPEVLLQKPYSTAADVYSVGIIMWEVWHGVRAHSDKTKGELYMEITIGALRPPAFACRAQSEVATGLCKKWQSLASRCWAGGPPTRPSARFARQDIISYSI